jgi:hypothetical protein
MQRMLSLIVEKVIPPGNAPFAGKLTDITMVLIAGGVSAWQQRIKRCSNKPGVR